MTWYNLLSDQFTGLNAIPVPGTLRDSLVLLAVVLEQHTELTFIRAPTVVPQERTSCPSTSTMQVSQIWSHKRHERSVLPRACPAK
jgi:hypothetical protein